MSDSGHRQQTPSEDATPGDTESRHSSKRFRFKSKPPKRHAQDDPRKAPESSSHRSPRHQRNHHRHKRRRLSPSPPTNSPPSHPAGTSRLHPDVAFRESLFDAMGDDEGAAYWESVYGQPIHTYPDEKCNEETGELEKMNEEEYIAFVRRGMWERSWEGVEAQREQRKRERLEEERERKKAKRTKSGMAGDSQAGAGHSEWEVEESLRRGSKRQERKVWREKWRAYEKAWDDLYQLARSRHTVADEADYATFHLRNEMIWPVESGKRKDVRPQEIERFMAETVKSLTTTDELDNEPRQLLSKLKVERVRWHPDKVQQRFGCLRIDEGTLKGVTEVFQVMDRLYNERR